MGAILSKLGNGQLHLAMASTPKTGLIIINQWGQYCYPHSIYRMDASAENRDHHVFLLARAPIRMTL
jgi:hypothetical protein